MGALLEGNFGNATAPAPHAPALVPGDQRWGDVGAAGYDEPGQPRGACSCPLCLQGLRTRLNVDSSASDLPRPASLPTQPAPQPLPLLRTPTFAKPQESPSNPAAGRARGTSLTSRCLQLLSPPEAARTDKLRQENKIQRAGAAPGPGLGGGTEKAPRDQAVGGPASFPGHSLPEGTKLRAGQRVATRQQGRCRSHTCPYGDGCHTNPPRGTRRAVLPPGAAGRQKLGGWRRYEETGRGRAGSGRLDGVAGCGLSSPPAPPPPPGTAAAPAQLPAWERERAEEFGGGLTGR